MTEKLLIIGAGHAAGQLVSTLIQRKYPGEITLVGDEPSLPYQRPPLSKKFLAGSLPAERLLVRPPSFYADAGVDVHTGQRIETLNTAAKTAKAADGRHFPYDKLVLALGARARRIRVPGARLNGVHYLRNIADVDAIRETLRPGLRISIVGAGYIGLEVAAIARDLEAEVTVIEATDRVLSRVVAPQISEVFQNVHADHGVRFEFMAVLEEFLGKDRVTSLRLADGRELATDLAIVGIGAEPNIELAAAADIAVDDGIVVDDRCQTSAADIFAVGDCTFHPNALLGRHIRLESVHNALEQARTAAANLCGDHVSYHEVPWFWSDQYDRKLQIAGLSAGYDSTIVRGHPHNGPYACLYLREGRLIAIDAVNNPKDFMQAKSLIAGGAMLIDDPADERVADVSVGLGELLRTPD